MKQILVCSIHLLKFIGERYNLAPNADRKSEHPDLEVCALFPCLATGTPHAATTNAAAVEILNVPSPSPPVPAVSIDPLGVAIFKDYLLTTSTASVISSTVSPLYLRAVKNADI